MAEPALLFVDTCAPRAYDSLGTGLHGLGGTEATILRVAFGLAPDMPVSIAQSRRTEAATRQSVDFLPWPGPVTGGTIVVINSWKLAVKLRRRHPHGRVALWLHVFPGRHNRAMGAALAATGVEVIAVSHSHRRKLCGFFAPAAPPVRVLYNPLADALAPDATPRDPDLLLFASAPHKGLDQVIARFARLRSDIPSLRLDIADPGYLHWPCGQSATDNLRWLGTLDQDRLIRHYRRALCLFMPQTSFAETFGLVIAEANATGCPALLHRGLGANDEIAAKGSALIDARDPAAILRAIRHWRKHPPRCRARPEFGLANVLAEWRSWIDTPRPFTGFAEITG